MTKKKYIQPDINIVILQHRHHLLGVSGVTTSSESNDVNMSYDENGGDQGEAW